MEPNSKVCVKFSLNSRPVLTNFLTQTSKIIRHLFAILCMICMVIHIGVITHEYLKYIATSNVKMETADIVQIPALSVCWRYLDLIDFDRFNSDTGSNLAPPDYSTLESRRSTFLAIQNKITVRQILEYTPKIEDRLMLIDSIVRFANEYDYHILDQIQTLENFIVLRTYTQEYVCYRIGMKNHGQYDYNRVMRTLNYPAMAFEIGFNISMFGMVKTMLPIVHLGTDLPHYSRLFSPKLTRYEENPPNRIYLTSQRINLRKLPNPYQTDCADYGNVDLPDQITKCLMKYTIDRFQRLPFTEILPENFDGGLNFPVIVPKDAFENSTEDIELTKAEDECHRKLRKPECYTYMYLTTLVDESTANGSVRFRVVLPNQPEISISFQPMTHFFDYVTYVLSCFGTWIGLSIIDFNPIDIIGSRSLIPHRNRRGMKSLTFTRPSEVTTTPESWSMTKNGLYPQQSSHTMVRLSKIESEMATLRRRVNLIQF